MPTMREASVVSASFNTQTGQAMAIFYGIFEEGEKQKAFEVLLRQLEDCGRHMDTGVLGARVLFHVLSNVEQPPMNTKEPIRAVVIKELCKDTQLSNVNGRAIRAPVLRGDPLTTPEGTSTDSALPRRHTKVLRFPSALRVPYCFRPSGKPMRRHYRATLWLLPA